jgi:hypothetical protein
MGRFPLFRKEVFAELFGVGGNARENRWLNEYYASYLSETKFEQNWSLKQIADALGCTKSAVSKMLGSDSRPGNKGMGGVSSTPVVVRSLQSLFSSVPTEQLDEFIWEGVIPASVRMYVSRLTNQDREFFRQHHIDLVVAASRPYERYTTNVIDKSHPVRKAFADPSFTRGQRSFMSRIAGQKPGFLYARNAPCRLGFRRVSAQIRPDGPVVRDARGYWHAHPFTPLSDPVIPDVCPLSGHASKGLAGRPLKRVQLHTAGEMSRHIEKEHNGVNTELPHHHFRQMKYALTPNPDKYVVRDGTRVRRHVALLEREAARLDVHLIAEVLFPFAERVFFVLEGSLKSDAVLSEILRTGVDASVFSVPSVTTWPKHELEQFAPAYLSGRQVIVIPDADWSRNSKVFAQAMHVRRRLRSLGLDAHVAAPPATAEHECECKPNGITANRLTCDLCGGYLKGVDDFLAAGGTLDDLHVLNREIPKTRWLQTITRDRLHLTKRQRDWLECLAELADDDGHLTPPSVSLSKLATVYATGRRTASKVSIGLRDAAVISADSSLEVEEKFVRTRWGTINTGIDWVEGNPTITVREEFRIPAKSVYTLGQLPLANRRESGSIVLAPPINDSPHLCPIEET